MEEYGVKISFFFCLAIFGKNIKSIGISKVLYIIFSFKKLWPIFALVVYFFYSETREKYFFIYKKKVW